VDHCNRIDRQRIDVHLLRLKNFSQHADHSLQNTDTTEETTHTCSLGTRCRTLG